MEPETLTIVVKGIGMVLAILGGIIMGNYGFRLYKDGVGAGRDLAVFEVGIVKLKAHSIGSIVMATAFLWAWAGVALSPNLEKENGRIHVFSFQAPGYEVEVGSVVTRLDMSNWSIKQDPRQVQGLFRDAVQKQALGQNGILKLNGQPACYDLSSVRVKQTNSGKYLVTAKVESGESWANLAFEPAMQGHQLAFVPTGVDKSSSDDSDPNQPSQNTYPIGRERP